MARNHRGEWTATHAEETDIEDLYGEDIPARDKVLEWAAEATKDNRGWKEKETCRRNEAIIGEEVKGLDRSQEK